MSACGNLSNEDIAFVEALPRTGDLHVRVPAQSAQPACALGEASQWAVGARETGDKLNAAVDAVLGVIDAIRTSSPTSRKPDLRVWSFPDQKHPGVQIEASLLRVATQPGSDPSAQPWSFAIDARRGGGAFQEILYAYFVGADARSGQGVIAVNFDASRALQINGPNDPTGVMMIHYDLGSAARTIRIELGATGLGLSQFSYFFSGNADGSGHFDYLFPDAQGNRWSLATGFTSSGAGTATLNVRTPLGATGTLDECWDATACLTYVVDPLSITPACGVVPAPLCVLGTPASCPTVP
ncbi:MAG: hypothetical protein ACJ79H_15530 [Myxococcales bacterium]